MTYIMIALGWILNLFYELIGNYGFAIILFTVFIKLVLLPLDIKQKKSMAKTQKIQPLLAEVQKKYANDKDKLNQETMKLYQKYGINPMGGCFPMLIQFPIIIALYWVVKKPITYMMGVDAGDVWRVAEAFNTWAAAHTDALSDTIKGIIPVTYKASRALADNTFGTYEIQIAQLLFKNPEILNHPTITSWGKALDLIDFRFLGMDLSEIPNLGALMGVFTGNLSGITLNTVLLWTIPVFSGLSSWLTSKISSGQQPKKDKNEVIAEADKPKDSAAGMGDTMKSMTLIAPIFSAWFAFTLPAAVGLYWTVSNLIMIIQQVVVTKYLVPDISAEELEGEIKNVKKGRKNRKKS